MVDAERLVQQVLEERIVDKAAMCEHSPYDDDDDDDDENCGIRSLHEYERCG